MKWWLLAGFILVLCSCGTHMKISETEAVQNVQEWQLDNNGAVMDDKMIVNLMVDACHQFDSGKGPARILNNSGSLHDNLVVILDNAVLSECPDYQIDMEDWHKLHG
jgi:hypothetical protein